MNQGPNEKLQSSPRSSIGINSLKFLSWNIQAPSTIEGNKSELDGFKKRIVDHDFICLQEIRQGLHLPGYRSFNNPRKDNSSGGVGILIKNEFINGAKIIHKEEGSDYLICKLDKIFFRQDSDIYLINVYAKPFNSSNSTEDNNGRDLIKKVEEIVNELKEKGEIILCGDFNSRISRHAGMISLDSDNFIPMPEDYNPDDFQPRFSQDKSSNPNGTNFLNLIMHNQLTILNGRTLGDYSGNFTSIQKNGCSVVDYFAVSKNIKPKINYLKIGPFTEYSDHKPLSIEMRCLQIKFQKLGPLESKYKAAPKRFIFNEENKSSFYLSQKNESSTEFLKHLNEMHTRINSGNSNQASPSDKIKDINDKFTEHIRSMASECFKESKNISKKKKNNNPWFNWQARIAKRELKKATKATSEFPSNDFIRQNFYLVKGSYKRLLKKSKTNYFKNLNKDIEDGKILNWQAFKKLKRKKSKKLDFDSHDMSTFESFFKTLYSDDNSTINSEKKEDYINKADKINTTSTHPEILNKIITLNEITSTIKSLKNGKASSIDMVSNEILKSLDENHLDFINKLFNTCLDFHIYPWNENVMSPIHKTGNISNPDNHRAISVSSVLGKVFSTILLDRLQNFRKVTCPDPPNQIGFTKGAQTYDHILTMQTIASKYKKLRKPVYSVFVDFKKAFDSVCRQALFYKMAKLGITGKFYNVLRNMYSNSTAYVKLSGHLSNKFQILKGTEQGHPLSPDLFKIFLNDLSPLLETNDCPVLANTLISHLLWADDLIMLSLSQKAFKYQLEQLGKYCNEWGIEINEIKTQVMIFGQKEKYTHCRNLVFNLQGKDLKVVESYCYLGIVLHNSGELRTAQSTLKLKAMRAFFGLKRTIIRSKLSFKALNTLFDSLIKPIVLYGAPIWTPSSAINKSIIKLIKSNLENVNNFIPKINRTDCEKIHLSFLKWALGVHRKASNIGVWGESGRYPLIYQSIRLTLNYYNRLLKVPHNTFVHAALKEQKLLKLPWYKNIEPLLQLDEMYHFDHVTAYRITNPQNFKNSNTNRVCKKPINNLQSLIKAKPLPCKKFRVKSVMDVLTAHFKKCWEHEKSSSSKLSFYHQHKTKFAREVYLDEVKGFSRRYNTTKLRISAHELEIEKGRYTNIPRENRICNWCNTSMGAKITECENHVLFECDLYADLRAKVITQLNNRSHFSPDAHYPPQVLQVNNQSLKSYLMQLLSPYTTHNLNEVPVDSYNIHHKLLQNKNLKLITPETESLLIRRSYIVNCICTFICHAMEKRKKHVHSLQENSLPNIIVFNFG